MRRLCRSPLALAGACGLLLLGAACGGSDRSSGTVRDPSLATGSSRPTAAGAPRGYIVETAVPVLDVYDQPGAAAPVGGFPNPWYYASDVDRRYPIPSVFYSVDRREGWVQVLLPIRPNGSTGWVRTSDVRLVPSRYHIDVDVSDHRLTVFDGDAVLLEDTVAVGAPDTPTPTGTFFLRVLLKAPNADTVYGPYAYGLSGHSDTLEEFDGGDAQTGIHGNDDASQLGKDVTHGCIRMGNDQITRLAAILPLGTPVEVHP